MIIGISGQARHGKDTIADYLVKNYGFQKMSLAQPLKEICRTIFSFNDEQLYGDQKESVDPRWGITPRHCLQFIGTELFRQQIGQLLPEIGDDIWVYCLCERLKTLFQEKPDTKVVICDVRFKNEYQALNNLEIPFHSIRVNNPHVEGTASTHTSEQIDLPYDHYIENSGTILELYGKVDELISVFYLT